MGHRRDSHRGQREHSSWSGNNPKVGDGMRSWVRAVRPDRRRCWRAATPDTPSIRLARWPAARNAGKSADERQAHAAARRNGRALHLPLERMGEGRGGDDNPAEGFTNGSEWSTEWLELAYRTSQPLPFSRSWGNTPLVLDRRLTALHGSAVRRAYQLRGIARVCALK